MKTTMLLRYVDGRWTIEFDSNELEGVMKQVVKDE